MSAGYSLHAVPVGTLPIPGWEAFFGINDPDFYDLAFYVWVVTDGTTVGLIDTGLPPDAADRDALDRANRQLDERSVFSHVRGLTEVLHETGIAPEEVDFVAITQTITYHTGGLDADALPRAQVYLSRAGIEEMLGTPPGHPPTAFYFTERTWTSLRTFAVQGRLHCVDAPTAIAPGIRFETTGGHHPGSAAVRVNTPEGVVGLLETAFLDRNVDEVRPIGIAENVARCRDVIREYRHQCDHVVALHDPANSRRFPISALQRKERA